jgi:hypothetical protein
MLKRSLKCNRQDEELPKEGDLYARIEHNGRTFELYYGYYEECDRQNPMVPPVPLYPDFLAKPQYDDNGYPFATEMQDACSYYIGKDPDDGCYTCMHYRSLIDFIGLCTCPLRCKKN